LNDPTTKKNDFFFNKRKVAKEVRMLLKEHECRGHKFDAERTQRKANHEADFH